MSAFTPQRILGLAMAKAKADTQFQRVGSSEKPIHRIYDNTPAGHEQLVSWLMAQQGGQDLQLLHQQQLTPPQGGPHVAAVSTATTAVLTCLDKQIASLRTQIEAHILAHESLSGPSTLLLSICGSGKPTAALLLGELGDLSRFPNVRDLLA